jgi:hypothetical protein
MATCGCRGVAVAKFIEHHCIAWNEANWRKPAGRKYSAHPKKIGWAHEEWNNSPSRVVGKWRGFHTQGDGKVIQQLAQQRLAIVMTSYHPTEKRHFLVGVACDVMYGNDDDDFKRKLSLRDSARETWASPFVRRTYKSNRARFIYRWNREYHVLAWKCRTNLYWWASSPVALGPKSIVPHSKRQLTWRYGTSQPLKRSKMLIEILRRANCRKSVLAWFDDHLENFGIRDASAPTNSGGKNGSAAGSNRPPDKAHIRYIRSYELKIGTKHHDLQKQFVGWLVRSGFIDIEENQRHVDVFCRHETRGEFLVEVKPCGNADEARYAARQGIGQLYDYRLQNLDRCPAPRLLIVLGAKPRPETLELLKMSRIEVAWRVGRNFNWRRSLG